MRPTVDVVAPDLYGTPGGIARIGRCLVMAVAGWAGAGRVVAHGLHDGLGAAGAPDGVRAIGYRGGRARLAVAVLGRAWARAGRAHRVVFAHPNLAVLGLALPPWASYAVVSHGIEVWQPLRGERARAMAAARWHWPVSENTGRYLQEVQGVGAERVRVIRNALSPGWSLPAVRGADEGYLLAVSRLSPEDAYKGVDLVIAAVGREPGLGPLVVAGDGPDRGRLEGLAKASGADVRFVGRVDDMSLERLFGGASAFVLPSAGEGFGLVYLEAMAHWLPCVAARAGGAPEVVADGETGVVVSPRDVGALVEAIRRVRGSEGVAMGRRGRARLEHEFLYDRYAREVEAALESW